MALYTMLPVHNKLESKMIEIALRKMKNVKVLVSVNLMKMNLLLMIVMLVVQDPEILRPDSQGRIVSTMNPEEASETATNGQTRHVQQATTSEAVKTRPKERLLILIFWRPDLCYHIIKSSH